MAKRNSSAANNSPIPTKSAEFAASAHGRRSAVSLASNMTDNDPFTLTKREPNPVKAKLSCPSLSAAGGLIPYRGSSKRNSPFGAFVGDEIDAILREKD